MVKNGCKNTILDLTNSLSKAILIRNVFIVIGSIGLVLGIGLPIILQATQNPFEEPNSFEFGASIGDFYVQDIDTSNNHTYFINQFKIQGARFSQANWNYFKEYNLTNIPEMPLESPFFYEITIFGAEGISNETYAQSCDNNTWVMTEMPILMITSIEMSIYRDDYEYFDNSYINLFDYEPIERFEYYRFLSDSVDQSMYFQLNGISYNYTSESSVNLFMRYNNVPFIIPAYY